MRQLVCHMQYVDIEFYCHKSEGDRISVVNQAWCKMDEARLEENSYIKIAVLRGRNAGDSHNELV